MLIKEYRVTLPLTVEEYQVAQLYCVADLSKKETGGGEGIEVVKNEPFKDYPLLVPKVLIEQNQKTKTVDTSKPGTNISQNKNVICECPDVEEDEGGQFSSGQYTYKIYHLASKVPAFIKMLVPKGALEVHEEAWNAYPYCRTVLTNPGYMKDNFIICIESLHLPDAGDKANVHELPPEKLKMREVVHIDIANDPVTCADYKPEHDPTKFKSVKTGRGPLVGPNWKDGITPVMTCYKLVTAEFKWFGLQTKVENVIHKSERRLFTIFHRQVFCTMDEWYGMTMADIRAIEERTKEELEKLRREGEVRGMRADND